MDSSAAPDSESCEAVVKELKARLTGHRLDCNLSNWLCTESLCLSEILTRHDNAYLPTQHHAEWGNMFSLSCRKKHSTVCHCQKQQ